MTNGAKMLAKLKVQEGTLIGFGVGTMAAGIVGVVLFPGTSPEALRAQALILAAGCAGGAVAGNLAVDRDIFGFFKEA